MFEIEEYYNGLINDIHKINSIIYDSESLTIDKQLDIGLISHELEKAIDKAKLYDLMRLKCSQAGKKAARNMTQKERTERARRASKARKSTPSIYGKFIKTKIQY
jgi:hypothetical protein